ncbi:MAG TPA: APC family permease [Rhabdochlamydiaceae bacterium]
MSLRTISVFTLAMINLAAIGGVKNWPVTAEYGFSAIFYFLLAAIIFFIPLSLVTAELATSIPHAGGVFAWVKEAFGHRVGFLAIWLQFVENVIWYPTILSAIAAGIAYVINPALSNNPIYLIILSLIVFWGATFANLFGMKTSGWISSMSVIFGTFIPGGIIILLGLIWFFQGNPSHITMNWSNFVPTVNSFDDLVFFTGVILTLCGMEMSAVHVREVKNPKRDFPKAILISAILIVVLSILGVLSIASILPQEEISLVAGSLQAFSAFVSAYNLQWLIPIFAILFTIGSFGNMSTWIVGPTKGLLAAAQSGDLPPYFRAVNTRRIPVRLLIGQAIIVSLLSLVFLFMPTVSSAFWILMALIAQVYLVMYLLLFAAAIKLRYSHARLTRPFKIPGGKCGIWIVGGLGILSSLFATIMGFFPPSQIPTGNVFFYVLFLFVSLVLSCIAPSIILLFQTPKWKKALAHEVQENILL